MDKKKTMIYRISYNEQKDTYETYFYVGTKRYPDWDEFKHEASYGCVQAWNADQKEPTENKDYLHFRIISGIRRALDFGYKIEFIDKPE